MTVCLYMLDYGIKENLMTWCNIKRKCPSGIICMCVWGNVFVYVYLHMYKSYRKKILAVQ